MRSKSPVVLYGEPVFDHCQTNSFVTLTLPNQATFVFPGPELLVVGQFEL
jgi:hypothetical protein